MCPIRDDGTLDEDGVTLWHEQSNMRPENVRCDINHLYITDLIGSTVWVLDKKQKTVIAQIPIPGLCHALELTTNADGEATGCLVGCFGHPIDQPRRRVFWHYFERPRADHLWHVRFQKSGD